MGRRGGCVRTLLPLMMLLLLKALLMLLLRALLLLLRALLLLLLLRALPRAVPCAGRCRLRRRRCNLPPASPRPVCCAATSLLVLPQRCHCC